MHAIYTFVLQEVDSAQTFGRIFIKMSIKQYAE
jgi:hypothetical protein